MYGSSFKGLSESEIDEIQEVFARRAEEEVNKSKNRFPQLWSLFQELDTNTFEEQAERAFNTIIECYSQSHRGYHNVDHLIDLARHFEDNRDLFKTDEQAILISLFYHDIVYEAQPGQDEEASIIMMMQELAPLDVDNGIIERAEQIIRLTATHDAPKGDFVARLFLDMDMAILGARPDDYGRYVEGVAKEFCTKHNISRDEFNQARIAMFVDPTIKKGSIFQTEQFKPYNLIAMRNLEREKSGKISTPQRKKTP